MLTPRDEKIIIGSALIIGLSAIAIQKMTRKYDEKTEWIVNELEIIDYEISKSREDIISGNRDIAEGNKLLRKLIKSQATEITNNITDGDRTAYKKEEIHKISDGKSIKEIKG